MNRIHEYLGKVKTRITTLNPQIKSVTISEGPGLAKPNLYPFVELWYNTTAYPNKQSPTGGQLTIVETPIFGCICLGKTQAEALDTEETVQDAITGYMPVLTRVKIIEPPLVYEMSVPFQDSNGIEGILFYFWTNWQYMRGLTSE